jgi:hypothetical protein
MDYTLIGGGWIAPTDADAGVVAMMAELEQVLPEAAELARLESDERPAVVARRRAVVSAARRLRQSFARHSAPAPLGWYTGAEAGSLLEVLGIGTAPLRWVSAPVWKRAKPTKLVLAAPLLDWGREHATPAEYMAALQIAAPALGDLPIQPLSLQVAEGATRVYGATNLLKSLIQAGMEHRPYRLEYALIRFFPGAEAWPFGTEDSHVADEVFQYEEVYTWEVRFPARTPWYVFEAARKHAVALNILLSAIHLYNTASRIR